MRGRIQWIHWMLVLASAGISNSCAQVPISTTVCAIAREPAAFAGKIVKLRSTVETGFESSAIVEPDGSCKGGMWFRYAPEKGEKANEWDGRETALQKLQPVFLRKDEDFKRFEDALDAHVYARRENSECMGCSLYQVTATMVGRVDYAREGQLGFGHLNAARVQFVMASVSDVSTVENHYDWNEWSRTPIRFPHGTVKGKVTDSEGKGVRFGEVEAVPIEGNIPISNPQAMTEEDGTYSLDLKPGRYLLVVNRASPATTRVPMNTTYYPSAERREQAEIVSVADGQTLLEHDIRPLRSLTVKHLRVRVIWPDGKAVEDANVNVAEADKSYAIAGDDDGGVKHTDREGWVTLLAYAGKSYRLYADIYKKPGYVPYCEDVFLLPDGFRDGMAVTMVLRRQSETCRGQWNEVTKLIPPTAIAP